MILCFHSICGKTSHLISYLVGLLQRKYVSLSCEINHSQFSHLHFWNIFTGYLVLPVVLSLYLSQQSGLNFRSSFCPSRYDSNRKPQFSALSAVLTVKLSSIFLGVITFVPTCQAIDLFYLVFSVWFQFHPFCKLPRRNLRGSLPRTLYHLNRLTKCVFQL